MSVDELLRLKEEKENKLKYTPLVRKIDNTDKQLYNLGSIYNKKTVYEKDRTETAIGQIERSFRRYVSSVAGVQYDSIIAWMDIGVVCKARVARDYVKSLAKETSLDDDGITYKVNADSAGVENLALQNNVLTDMVAVRIYDVTVDNPEDYDTSGYEIDGLVNYNISYGNDIFLVKFDEFIAVLNALGYRVVSRGKKIASFQDYLDAFMDFENEDGFRIIADFNPERKKQKEKGDSAFKYLFTSGKKNEDKAGMLN